MKRAFMDMHGSFWVSRRRRDLFERHERCGTLHTEVDLIPAIEGVHIGKIVCMTYEEYNIRSWAVENIFPEKLFPEYYI